MQSTCTNSSFKVLHSINLYRCTALPADLDSGMAGRRTHELTDEVLAAFDSDILWDEYGIDADIIVSYPSSDQVDERTLATIVCQPCLLFS